MPIIEQCVHGKRTIGECRDCKKVYYERTKNDTSRWLWKAAKSRARIKGLAFTITPDDVKVPMHCPVLGIDAHGSAGGFDPPFCRSSTEIPSGERTNAMWPSRGGRLIVTPAAWRRAQVA